MRDRQPKNRFLQFCRLNFSSKKFLQDCFLLICLAMLVFQCSNSDTIITPSFYHWQTSFQLSKNEDHLLQQSNVHKLYIKFFDVDWSFQQNKAIPLASVIFPDKGIKDLEVVPTIFITNRTFLQIPPEKLDTLAQLVSLKIDQLGMGLHWKEVQIDCDWTRKTQSKYFDFLQSLKEILSSQVYCFIHHHSATPIKICQPNGYSSL